MADTLIGKGFVVGTGGTYTGYATNGTAMSSGYVTNKIPVDEGINLSHNAEVERVQDADGDYCALILTAEYVEATFEMRPEGTTIANALGAATMPQIGATFVITGLPIIACGQFSDVFNVGGDGIQLNRWVYEGGGSIRMTNTGKAMTTLPLRRYPSLAPAAAITE